MLKLCILYRIASCEKGTFSSSREPTEVSRKQWTCKTAPKDDVCIVVEAVVLLRVRISKYFLGSSAGYCCCCMLLGTINTNIAWCDGSDADGCTCRGKTARVQNQAAKVSLQNSPKDSTIRCFKFLYFGLPPPVLDCLRHSTARQQGCARSSLCTSPVHLDLLGKLVRGIAGQDLPANQLPSPVLPSLSLCRHHPPTSTKDSHTR